MAIYDIVSRDDATGKYMVGEADETNLEEWLTAEQGSMPLFPLNGSGIQSVVLSTTDVVAARLQSQMRREAFVPNQFELDKEEEELQVILKGEYI